MVKPLSHFTHHFSPLVSVSRHEIDLQTTTESSEDLLDFGYEHAACEILSVCVCMCSP